MGVEHRIEEGIPYICGQKAVIDPMNPEDVADAFMIDVLSDWRCPICNARLSKSSLICLNACHLTGGTRSKFNALWEGK